VAHGALARLGAKRGLRRLLQGLAVAVVLVVTATVTGSLTHSADTRDTSAAAQGRLLLRLVGGGPELTLDRGVDGSTGGTSVQVEMQLTVRNDGARPEQIVSADVQQPGITLEDAVRPMTVAPGDSQAVALRLVVACNRVDLPEYPDAVTLGLRGPDGRTTRRVFAFGPGHPAPPTVAFPGQQGFFGTAAPGFSYFTMCSEGILNTPAISTYLGLTGSATAADPTIRNRISVHSTDLWSRVLGPLQGTATPSTPGISTSTDLAGPATIDQSPGRVVTVTDRVTDCAAAGQAMTVDGLPDFVIQARDAVGLGVRAADARFQAIGPMALAAYGRGPTGADGRPSQFETDFIEQLAAACPGLK
jgi:hypothetical protein